jgi:S1-C subfamily serine protease
VKAATTVLTLLLAILPAALLAQDPIATTPVINWRDAPTTSGESELDRLNRAFVQLANQSRPAIVQVRVTGSETKTAQSQSTGSRGSGFIIDPQGYILTAQHVIDKAKEIEIRLADLQRLPARVIAADNQIDVAILKIDTERELTILPIGDSDAIRVGDLAVLFGFPFGRESSMNLGIISRSGRSYPDSASYDFIQTDAGAYAGGSGGPLLNRQGPRHRDDHDGVRARQYGLRNADQCDQAHTPSSGERREICLGLVGRADVRYFFGTGAESGNFSGEGSCHKLGLARTVSGARRNTEAGRNSDHQ